MYLVLSLKLGATTEKIKAKVYDRFLFCTQDTIESVSDLVSIDVL